MATQQITRLKKTDEELRAMPPLGPVLIAIRKCYELSAIHEYQGTVLEIKPLKEGEEAKKNSKKGAKQKLYLATKTEGWYWKVNPKESSFGGLQNAAILALPDLKMGKYSAAVRAAVNYFEAMVPPASKKQYSSSGLDDLEL